MADVRFTGLAAITRLRAGDVFAVDNPGPGSAKITPQNAMAGLLLDFGVWTMNNSDFIVVNFNFTLAVVPTSFELSFMCPGGGGVGDYVVNGNVQMSTVTTSQFTILLTGLPGDTAHKVRWKAFLD